MKLPLKWFEDYIKLDHTPKEFAEIMTSLEFLQDGPIKEAAGQEIVDLEVRQNRSDSFSIIGLAREYAAYLDKKIDYPEAIKDLPIEWGTPDNLLSINAKDLTKRFCAVQIKNIEIKESPEWMKRNLEAYGIPSINNVVDITNYVMLEYGMPLHAFDMSKLTVSKEETTPLTIRKAKTDEKITTWQGTEISLTNKDLIISSGGTPVGIAGITGSSNSGIDENTKEIILESACYDQASIRKTSLRHGLRTDSSTRHEKFLNPEMVETAIRRALFLINEFAGGEITKIEDFYEEKHGPTGIEFNLLEISRLGGVQVDYEEAGKLLMRLGFEIIEHKEAIGLNQNIIVVRVPMWRTDIKIEADVLEEILRLWGYENIPLQPLREAPEDYSTTPSIRLEDKIRDILVNLGLDEHITNPLVQYDETDKHKIKLENPLNKDRDALRTHIIDTLRPAVITNKKANKHEISVFEVGKIYFKVKEGDFKEYKVISTLYDGYSFVNKIKPDFLALLSKLGFDTHILKWESENNYLIYSYDNVRLGTLRHNGYDLLTENLINIVDLQLIPSLQIKTSIPQVIIEKISFIARKDFSLGTLESLIYKTSPKIVLIRATDKFLDDVNLGKDNASVTLSLTYEDIDNTLTREDIQTSKDKIIDEAKKLGLNYRS